MFTMWTVGSNPTLSVELRATRIRNEGVVDMPDPWMVPSGPFVLVWSLCPARSFHHSFGAVAQLGERQNRNLEVGGSIPLCSTRKAGRQAVGATGSRCPCLPALQAWFDYGRARWGVSGAL